MGLNVWSAKVGSLALTAWVLALPGENSQCQAQVLRSTAPFHLDDSNRSTNLAQPGSAEMGAGTVATVAAIEAIAASQSPPPPLPESGLDARSPLSLAPAPSTESTSQADAQKTGVGADGSSFKNPARKSYLPEQKPISQISIDVNSKSKSGSSIRPENVVGTATEELPAVMGATAAEMHLGWTVTAYRTGDRFGYKPLYFEEVNLERYGRSAGFWQPAISTTRFFGTVPLLPYKMAAHSPHRVYFWDWPYPAGAPAPQVRETFPLQPKAALVEASVLTGGAFLIP